MTSYAVVIERASDGGMAHGPRICLAVSQWQTPREQS